MKYDLGELNKIANCLVEEMKEYTKDMKHPKCSEDTAKAIAMWRRSTARTLYKTMYFRTMAWGAADKLFDDMTKDMLTVSERTDIIKSVSEE